MKKSFITALLLISIASAEDIEITNGWNNIGADNGISIESLNKSCIDLVWKYNKGISVWSAYSPNPTKANLIANNQNISILDNIGNNEAIWVLANSDCLIESDDKPSSSETNIDGLAFSDTDSETLTNFQTMCSNMSPDFKIGEGYSPKNDDYYGNAGNGLKFASARAKYNDNGKEIDSSMTLFYPILSDEDIAKLTFAESDIMGDINKTSFIPPNDDKEVNFYIYFESLYYGKKFYTAYEIQGDFGTTYSCEEWTFIQTNFEL